jgi:hypothetical protein
MPKIVMSGTDAARFWARVDVRGDNECWNWQGPTRCGGYGQMSPRVGDNYLTHRVAYALTHPEVELTPKDVVRHSCIDNRRCCNPAHLRLGTQADNINDKVEQDRQARGERIGISKLTAAMVVEIVTRYAEGGTSSVQLAREYGVSKPTVLRILDGRTWKHVPRPDVAGKLRAARRSQPEGKE